MRAKNRTKSSPVSTSATERPSGVAVTRRLGRFSLALSRRGAGDGGWLSASDDISQSKKEERSRPEQDVADAPLGAEDIPEVNAADGDE